MIECCVVIGSSKGLGAALVDELLTAKAELILGISRTGVDDIPSYTRWENSGHYRHVAMDIGQSDSVDILQKRVIEFPPKPLLIIYNAACLVQEVNKDQSINYDIFDEVNRVGVNGFSHVLRAFEKHLLAYGGTLVDISSINATKPPILEPRVAYGATKAYLHMAMRCLRVAWPEKIRLLTVHLGHIGGNYEDGFWSMLYPTYSKTAKKIVQTLRSTKMPHQITYPFVYYIAYDYVLKIIPDFVYCKMLRVLLSKYNLSKQSIF